MNKIYRLIWSEITRSWKAVSETAKGRGKSGPSSVLIAALLMPGLQSVTWATSPSAAQLPSGGQVVAGSASISQTGSTMTIQQVSDRVAIDWQSFSIGSQAKVNFVQPSSTSVALNRVVGSQASQIFGQLTSNGRVYLSNGNGVYFSPGSSVNVGGLVATTHSISNADFMSGNDKFTRNGSTGSVVNEGNLTAEFGGYIALLAPEVRNKGVIIAKLGTVALAAGELFELQFDARNALVNVRVEPSAINALVDNGNAVLAPGGLIILSSQGLATLKSSGIINNTGTLSTTATGLTKSGGRIFLSASSQITLRGKIEADAAAQSNGNGGVVLAIANLANADSSTLVDGQISARGGDSGGDGGEVETSGSQLKITDTADVNTSAAQGSAGLWLLDPDGYTVSASGGNQSGAQLSQSLLTNGTVQILSTNGSGADGNVNINDVVSWSSNKLTLTATNNVNINAVMTVGGSGTLDLVPGSAGTVRMGMRPDGSFKGRVDFSNTGAGLLTIGGQSYTVIGSLGTAGSTSGTELQGIGSASNLGGKFALGANIDAAATSLWNAESGFQPIGTGSTFTGVFNGLGHVVSNLKISRVATSNVGLFSQLSSAASVRNLALAGGTVSGSGSVGAVVGLDAGGTVDSVYSSVAVTGTGDGIGGLVGIANTGSTISNSGATGDVTGTGTASKYLGGLVGKNAGKISASYATGDVSGTFEAGGLVGNNAGTINNAFARGGVAATGTTKLSTSLFAYAGGLVGHNSSASSAITNSYSTGAVANNSKGTVGGLVGVNAGGSQVASFWDATTSGQAASALGTSQTSAQLQAAVPGAWNSNIVWTISPGINGGYAYLCSVAVGCVNYSGVYLRLNTSAGTSSVYGNLPTLSYALYTASSAGTLVTDALPSGSATWSQAFSGTSAVGTYSLAYVSGVSVGNDIYILNPGAAVNWSISARPLGVAVSKTYDGTTAFSTGFSLSGVVNGDTVALNAKASVTGTSANAGVYDRYASASNLTLNNTNYIVGSFQGTITPKTVTLSAAKAYSGDTTLKAADVTVSGLVGKQTLAASAGTVFSKDVADSNNYISTLTLANGTGLASNYQLPVLMNAVNAPATITPAALTVSASGVDRVYDGTTKAQVTLLDNRLSVLDTFVESYSASFADKNVGTAKTVSVTGISLTGTGASNYTVANAKASTTTTANVTQANLTVSATAVGRVYDATTAASVSLSDNRILGDALTDAFVSATFSDKNVGLDKTVTVSGISLGGKDAGNYKLTNTAASAKATITAAALTVSATGVNRSYDATTVATVTLSDSRTTTAMKADNLNETATATFADKNVGKGKTVTVSGITLSGTDAGNYTLSNTAASTTATVTAFALTVSATGIDRTYDATTVAAVALSDSRVTAAMKADNLTETASAAFADKNAGVDKAVSVSGITLGGADAGNYTLNNTKASTTATISSKLLTLTATATDRVYDATTTAVATVVGDDRIAGDTLTYTFGSASFATKDVGTNKPVSLGVVTLGGKDAGNYTANSTANSAASITAAPLTVSATGVDRTYDATTVATVTLSDSRTTAAMRADNLSQTATATFADKTAGVGKTVSVSGITLGGTDVGNYTLQNTTASTIATVNKADLTVSATGVDRTYDATTVATVTLSDSRTTAAMKADNLSENYAGAAFADKNADVAKTLSVSGITLSGADADNYTLKNTTAITAATIAKAALTVSGITAADKTYDATRSVAVSTNAASYSGLFSGDAVTVSSTGTFADKNAGTAKTVSLSNTYGGLDVNNYTIAGQSSTKATVNKADLTVSATGINRTYAAHTFATVALSDNRASAEMKSDVLTGTATTAVFADKNAGVAKTVIVSGITLTGQDADNYTLKNTSASTKATISPAILKVAALGLNRPFDSTTKAGVVLFDDRFAGDALVARFTSANFNDSNPAMNKPILVAGVRLEGPDAGNYSLFSTTLSATANVASLALTGSGGQSWSASSLVLPKIAMPVSSPGAVKVSVSSSSPPAPRGNATAPAPVPGGSAAAPAPVPGGNAAAPAPVPGGSAAAPAPVPGGSAAAPAPVPGGSAGAAPAAGGDIAAPAPGGSAAAAPAADGAVAAPAADGAVTAPAAQ